MTPAGEAFVRLRLPTYFCAPNFAFLMVADAHDAVSAVSGVRRAVGELDDHFAADAINGGVAARAGFVDTFAGEAAQELDSLRADFLRKAVLAGTDRVCRALVAAGADPASLAGLTLGDAPPSADSDDGYGPTPIDSWSTPPFGGAADACVQVAPSSSE